MWAFSIKLALAVFIVVGVLASASPVQAVTLSELLVDLVQNQKQIKAAESDLEAAEERARLNAQVSTSKNCWT